ncbi:hypothetical protein E3N88_34393 [Mikania micrantha]|uniref:DYW domain-containing protein n=1 Tax=Mikania micrantha TaxID=192012 RepID=A0A5N6M0M1_9ASTR|nr:hypothetical protein E3N88_34393 [Mikania micrantha]
MVNCTTVEQSYISLLKYCKTLKSVKQVHAHLFKSGIDSDTYVTGNLILHCAIIISDGLHHAHSLLLHFSNPDAFMFNTIIRAFSGSDNPHESLTTFINMRRNSNNLQPDSFSFAFVLKSVANLRDFNTGIQLHTQAIIHGLDTHLFVGTTLVRLSHNGCFNEAFDLFIELQRVGLKPNEASLTGILSVCAQAGAFEFGKILHGYIMKSGFTSIHTVNNALLDTYSKCGNIKMARLVFERMPSKKTIVSWTTMMAGLAMQGYGEEALELFHQMEESGIKPDGITFVSVLYACSHAVAGKWKNVTTVRKSMNSQRLTKSPGWSMVEVDKIMYRFVAGDEQSEANASLEKIMLRLRVEGGYAPEVFGSVLHDIEDEEKENAVVTHSEKLALAFAMSRLCEEKVIRIVKNLRVCKDCHMVMKLVSKIFKLEIVLRDRSRFHTFSDGGCSCRDYW